MANVSNAVPRTSDAPSSTPYLLPPPASASTVPYPLPLPYAPKPVYTPQDRRVDQAVAAPTTPVTPPPIPPTSAAPTTGNGLTRSYLRPDAALLDPSQAGLTHGTIVDAYSRLSRFKDSGEILYDAAEVLASGASGGIALGAQVLKTAVDATASAAGVKPGLGLDAIHFTSDSLETLGAIATSYTAIGAAIEAGAALGPVGWAGLAVAGAIYGGYEIGKDIVQFFNDW